MPSRPSPDAIAERESLTLRTVRLDELAVRTTSRQAAATAADLAPSAGVTAPAPRERDAFLDNAKGIAIVLVVVGHFLALVLDVPIARHLYLWIYSFHMPVFVLISGHLSRNWTGTPEQYRKLVTTLLLPFAVFQVIYQVEQDLVSDRGITVNFVDPQYVLWFLMSLFLWRLATPLLRQLRWPLLVAIGLSLGAGLSDRLGTDLSLGRTFGLLPFFVAGLLLRREHFALLARPAVRVAAVVVAVGGFVAVVALQDVLRLRWFYWREGYHDAGLSWSEGLVVRGTALVVATLMAAAFLALVPRRRSVLSTLGAGTMYAFLLHGLLTQPMKTLDTLDGVDSAAGVALVVVVAAAIGVLLLTPPVRRATSWLVDLPAGARLLRRP